MRQLISLIVFLVLSLVVGENGFIHAYSGIWSSTGQSLTSYKSLEKRMNNVVGQSNRDIIKASITTSYDAHPTIHRATLKKASTGSSASKSNMLININKKISSSNAPSPTTTKRAFPENKVDDYVRARAVSPDIPLPNLQPNSQSNSQSNNQPSSQSNTQSDNTPQNNNNPDTSSKSSDTSQTNNKPNTPSTSSDTSQNNNQPDTSSKSSDTSQSNNQQSNSNSKDTPIDISPTDSTDTSNGKNSAPLIDEPTDPPTNDKSQTDNTSTNQQNSQPDKSQSDNTSTNQQNSQPDKSSPIDTSPSGTSDSSSPSGNSIPLPDIPVPSSSSDSNSQPDQPVRAVSQAADPSTPNATPDSSSQSGNSIPLPNIPIPSSSSDSNSQPDQPVRAVSQAADPSTPNATPDPNSSSQPQNTPAISLPDIPIPSSQPDPSAPPDQPVRAVSQAPQPQDTQNQNIPMPSLAIPNQPSPDPSTPPNQPVRAVSQPNQVQNPTPAPNSNPSNVIPPPLNPTPAPNANPSAVAPNANPSAAPPNSPNPTAAPDSPQAAFATPIVTVVPVNSNSPNGASQTITLVPTSEVLTSVVPTVATILNSKSSYQLTTYSVTNLITTSYLAPKPMGSYTPEGSSISKPSNTGSGLDFSDTSHIIGPILGAITAAVSIMFIAALVIIRRKKSAKEGHFKLDEFDYDEFDVNNMLQSPEMAHMDSYNDAIDPYYNTIDIESTSSSNGGSGAVGMLIDVPTPTTPTPSYDGRSRFTEKF
ncbi:5007_t:CDS:2 [Dentiscutata heterogama]|uniref:5007_t:CDS:1 n=1 Tax=Dentiscutata heterogama TaxID=1316150 RepID=A0ACA9KP21_9GLOM|nr:5007_t:CDS:2 [Dentiscutata heterogama]